MIEIKNLSKTYDNINKAVENLTLSIADGSVFGFLGPNGAGKTTSIKIIVGINKPDKGSVLIDSESPDSTSTREKIGFMPEEPRFYDQLTGLEFMRFASDLFKHSKPSKELEEVLQKVGIYEARNKKIKNYSKGMKQRLGFAQALVNDPKYIFLDEPLEGLDPIGRREVKIIMSELKRAGKTIFFNSHILSDVEDICDQIGIINNGRLIYQGPVKEFKQDKSLEEKFVEVIKNLNTHS